MIRVMPGANDGAAARMAAKASVPLAHSPISSTEGSVASRPSNRSRALLVVD